MHRNVETVLAAARARAAEVALDLVEVLELAWHDCYGDVTPPPDVIDDILVCCSEGRLDRLIRAVPLAVSDRRDRWLWAEDRRREA